MNILALSAAYWFTFCDPRPIQLGKFVTIYSIVYVVLAADMFFDSTGDGPRHELRRFDVLALLVVEGAVTTWGMLRGGEVGCLSGVS